MSLQTEAVTSAPFLSEFPVMFLVRLGGEVTTKSRRVRARFQSRLMANMEQALTSQGLRHRVRHEWSRLFVLAESDEAAGPLQRTFGVQSFSPIRRCCPPELDEIVRAGYEEFAEDVRGKKYAVRAHRSGVSGFSSLDIHVQLGRALNEYAEVDLDRPDITVQVEVRPEAAYFFCEHFPGAGGLPVGVQGRAVALISGGFDSAVAAWMLLRRGVHLDYVLCNLAGAAYERSVLRVVKHLAEFWSYGSSPQFHTVDFQPIVAAIRKSVTPKYSQVVLKRLMYRVGAAVANDLSADAVITGEAVGQVSSQTLSNLRAIDEVSPLPVLRPLIGMDKEEIIARSRHIGTCALSSHIQEYCALSDRPVTAAKLPAVLDEESRLDLSLLDSLTADRKTLDVASLDDSQLVLPYVFTGDVPEDAVVIDCRQRRQYEAWHWPDARHFEMDELMKDFRKLDKSKTYVLYCPIGLQSAVAAEKMQQAGYEAYSFQGGSGTLREHARQLGLEW